jgi:hypothetical protein
LYRADGLFGKCHVLLIHVPWFDQCACSFVPTCPFTGIARKPGQIRRSRRDRSHAQPACGRAWRGPTI